MKIFLGQITAVLVFVGLSLPAEETNSLSVTPLAPESPQLRAEVESMHLANEKMRDRFEELTRQNSALTDRLGSLEKSILAQKDNEIELIRNTNRMGIMVSIGAIIAAFGAVLIGIWLQSRSLNKMLEFAGHIPSLQAPRSQMLEGASGEVNARLLGLLNTLKSRVLELEHGTVKSVGRPASHASEQGNHHKSVVAALPGGDAPKISVLLAKGQTLLELDRPEEAIGCFDEVIAIDGTHAEAYLKRGIALERSQRLDQSINSYDHALKLNPSLHVAYLYKGRVLQELERYGEALSCYERALDRKPEISAFAKQ